MFNFTLEPSNSEKIESGSLYIELPVYRDLLGSEYDLVEQMDVDEMTWNTKLLELTEKLAKGKNMLLVDVFELLNKAEVSTKDKQIEFLGEYFPEFVQIINSKPNFKELKLKLITEICKRADPSITLEDVSKLPRGFTQKIHDFAIREQIGESTESYKELLAKKTNLEFEFDRARVTIDQIYKLNQHKKSQTTQVIESYYAEFDSMGKQKPDVF